MSRIWRIFGHVTTFDAVQKFHISRSEQSFQFKQHASIYGNNTQKINFDQKSTANMFSI